MDGHDAFGISKSFNPISGTYKKATDLTNVERQVIRVKAKAKGKSVRLKTKSGGERILRGYKAKKPSSKGREITPGIKTERGKLTQVMASRHQTGMHDPQLQGYSIPDGRGGGHVTVHTDARNPMETARHEMAHIKPRRNPIRFRERTADEGRKGGEEGRADFVARGKATPGEYPGSDKFQRGYNEVQGRMTAAKWRKDKFGKSAFGVEHVEKAMNPTKMKGLEAAARGGKSKDKTHMAIYARARLQRYAMKDRSDRAINNPSKGRHPGAYKAKGISLEKENSKRSLSNALAQASPYKNIGSNPARGKRLEGKRVLP